MQYKLQEQIYWCYHKIYYCQGLGQIKKTVHLRENVLSKTWNMVQIKIKTCTPTDIDVVRLNQNLSALTTGLEGFDRLGRI